MTDLERAALLRECYNWLSPMPAAFDQDGEHDSATALRVHLDFVRDAIRALPPQAEGWVSVSRFKLIQLRVRVEENCTNREALDYIDDMLAAPPPPAEDAGETKAAGCGWVTISDAPMFVYGRDALIGQWVDGAGWKKVSIWEREWTRDDIVKRGGTHWWPHLRDLPPPQASDRPSKEWEVALFNPDSIFGKMPDIEPQQRRTVAAGKDTAAGSGGHGAITTDSQESPGAERCQSAVPMPGILDAVLQTELAIVRKHNRKQMEQINTLEGEVQAALAELADLRHDLTRLMATCTTETNRAEAAERTVGEAVTLFKEWLDDEIDDDAPAGSFLGRVKAWLSAALAGGTPAGKEK